MLVAEDDEARRLGARAAHGRECGKPGGGRVEHLDAQAGQLRRALRETGGRDDVRRPVDELAGDVRPPGDDLGPGRGLGLVLARPADDEALDAGVRCRALPPARAVAAEDRTFDDRLHLAVLRHRQGVVDHPRDRACAAARPHDPGRSRPQILRVESAGRDERDPPRAELARHLHECDRVRVRRRADEAAVEAGVELAHRQASRGQGKDVGLDLGRSGCGQFDVHHLERVLVPPVRARILGSAAGGGFPQWNCRCPTCQAARTGTAARPRTQSSLAIRGADRSVVPGQRLAGPAPAARGARGRTRGGRPCRARGRGPADGCGDRPHGGPAAPARVLDGDPGVRERRGARRPDRRLSGAADPRRLLRRRLAHARARGLAAARRLILARGRVVRGRRRRAALPRRAATSRPAAWSSATARPAAS